MGAQVENRRSRRITVHGEGDGGGASPFKAAVVNLSREGVCVEMGTKLEPGQTCEFKFRIPPMSFAVRARIVWSSPHARDSGPRGGSPLYRAGAEFVNLSDDARAVIESIVARPAETQRPGASRPDEPAGPPSG